MYRSRVSSFNHAQLLTHGNPIGFTAITTRLNDAAAGSVEAVCSGDEQRLFAQAEHSLGDRSARLNFITPEPIEDHPGLTALLEFMCIRTGEMGAANLLAEVRESSQLLEVFRRSGFNICGWETIWRFPMDYSMGRDGQENGWIRASSKDESVVRSLYTTLVPPILQTVEPYQSDIAHTLLYRQGNELLACVMSVIGPRGIYLKPVIHPSQNDPAKMLAELADLYTSLGKPVYLQMRSFQAWLTAFLEDMKAESTTHFALMSHRLAILQYAAEEQPELVVKHRRVQTTSPIVQKNSQIGQ